MRFAIKTSPQHTTFKDMLAVWQAADEMPIFGPHPVTVPGAVDGWFTMLERWGTRSFGDVATTALRYAEEGFRVTARGAWFFNRSAEMFAAFG